MNIKFEIKHRYSGSIIFSAEAENIKLAVKMALEQKVVLRGAVLRGAVLSGAVLSDADLSGAVLRGADLSGAVLRGAVLRGAVLRGAVLRGADLTPIRDDFWIVLLSAPAEVGFLRQALVDGKVNGSTYNGDCACLVGTIANARKCDVQLLGKLKPNQCRPAERFFLGIKPGDIPEKSQFAKLAVEWLDEFVSMQVEAAKVFAK